MADREKVIKGLEICKTDLWSRDTCKITGCPYADIPDGTLQYRSCRIKLMTDALSLLKAQEPIEPIKHLSTGQICGSCKKVLLRKYKYCPSCGKAVKWE